MKLYKGFGVIVVIVVYIFQIVYAKENKNETTTLQVNSEKFKNKTKRGVFYVGRGLPNTYASLFGYHTPLITSPFVGGAQVPYVLKPGGATVTSYNVNYLRHPYYATKTFSNLSPFGTTLLSPVFSSGPVFPVNSVIPANPVVPAAPVIPANPVLPTNPVIPASSLVPATPSIPSVPAPAPVFPAVHPLFPSSFIIPQRPVIPLPIAPQKPSILPSASGTFPSVIPVSVPGQNIPTTVITPTTATFTPTSPSFPSHPQHNYGHGQPWRPVISSPTFSTPTISHGIARPSISLLPPYEGSSHRANLEDFQSPLSREYLSPDQFQRHQFATVQSDQQQQSEISNQVDSLEHNNYFGVSSYDVPLSGNKGYNY